MMYGNDLVQVDEQDYRHKDVSWMEMDDLVYDNPSLSMVHSCSLLFTGHLGCIHDDGTLLCKDTISCWYGYPRFKMYALNQEQRPDRQDGGKMDMYIYRVAEKSISSGRKLGSGRIILLVLRRTSIRNS
jgi:hypothetical protein